MTVALSIVGAAILGGLVFMLLERWQRDPVAPAPAPRVPDSALPPLWTPEPDTYSSWRRPSAAETEAETRPLPPWPPEEDTRPLPRDPEPEPPRRESPPLWTPPPGGSSSGRWDDDDRYRGRDRDDEDDPPPGLWSGWARR